MTLSNWISCSRILLSAFLLVALHLQTLAGVFGAALIFALASLTDYWDGWVARKRGEQSTLGAFLDPLADKCLLLAAFWSFAWLRLVPLWMVALITVREVLITVVRTALLPRREVGAIWSGKQKTVSQIVMVSIVLLLLLAEQVARHQGCALVVFQQPLVASGVWWLMLWTTIVTVVSGFHLASQWHEAFHPAMIFATVGGLGFVPVAPGLMGSLAGLYAAYALRLHPLWAALVFILGCALAVPAIPAAERRLQREDAAQIVMDETLGMLLAVWGVPWHWPSVVGGFVAFRLLDVVKPLGIRRLERLSTPWGVLLDDLACSVLVNAGLQLVTRW